MISQALNWSDMYQHPTILLVDKQLTEGYKTVLDKDLITFPLHRGEIAKGETS
jgi:hypothetical protein